MEVRSDFCNVDWHVTKSTLDALDELDLSLNKADTLHPYKNMKVLDGRFKSRRYRIG